MSSGPASIARILLATTAATLLALSLAVTADAESDARTPITEVQHRAPQPATFIPSAGCTSVADWPKDQIPATAQVQPYERYDVPVRTTSFDEAWTANHDADKTNDLYVIGLCR